MASFGNQRGIVWQQGTHSQLNAADSLVGLKSQNPRAIARRCFLLLSGQDGDGPAPCGRSEIGYSWKAGSHSLFYQHIFHSVMNFQDACSPDHIGKDESKYAMQAKACADVEPEPEQMADKHNRVLG